MSAGRIIPPTRTPAMRVPCAPGLRRGALRLGCPPSALPWPGSKPFQVVYRGPEGIPETMSLEALLQQENTPCFFHPLVTAPSWEGEEDPSFPEDLPMMVFLPGVDSTAASSALQWEPLSQLFDLRCLSIPVDDRTSFDDLSALVGSYIAEEMQGSPASRPVYVMGESVGAVIALQVALWWPDMVHRLVLINPATSYARSRWNSLGFTRALSQVPDAVYEAALAVALPPLLANPLRIAAQGVDVDGGVLEQAVQLGKSLVGTVLPNASAISEVVPKGALVHRLAMCEEGGKVIEPQIFDVTQRTLVVSGTADKLLPSKEESRRLVIRMQRCKSVDAPGKSHAMLLERGVDMGAIISKSGFYTTDANFFSPSSDAARDKGNERRAGGTTRSAAFTLG